MESLIYPEAFRADVSELYETGDYSKQRVNITANAESQKGFCLDELSEMFRVNKPAISRWLEEAGLIE